WKVVNIEAITSPTRERDRYGSSDDEAPVTKKRKGIKKKEADWTRTDAVIHFEDSDSSIVEIIDEEKKKDIKAQIKPKEKPQKPQVTRRRSITPPPVVSKRDLERAFQVTSDALFGAATANLNETYTVTNDDDDMEEDDPETRAIIERARLSIQDPAYHASSPPVSSPQSKLEPQVVDSLKLAVVWKGQPREDIPPKWRFRFTLTAPFRSLNEMMQVKTQLKEQDIVLVYDSRRILLGATPKSLKMRKDTSETIEIYPKEEWLSRKAADAGDESDDLVEIVDDDDRIPPSQQDQYEEADDTIVLNIRSSKQTVAIPIRAKKTAKAFKILLHYLKKLGENPEQYDVQGNYKSRKQRIRLSFDGEELNPEDPIGNTDAEDEDMWDVLGFQ
ncbi:hypothetical protein FRC17_004653, partial [Serendipita sp. 399]